MGSRQTEKEGSGNSTELCERAMRCREARARARSLVRAVPCALQSRGTSSQRVVHWKQRQRVTSHTRQAHTRCCDMVSTRARLACCTAAGATRLFACAPSSLRSARTCCSVIHRVGPNQRYHRACVLRETPLCAGRKSECACLGPALSL